MESHSKRPQNWNSPLWKSQISHDKLFLYTPWRHMGYCNYNSTQHWTGTSGPFYAPPTTLLPIRKFLWYFATGWTVRGSNPGGGEIFHTHPDWPWGLPSLLYNGYRVFPGGKAAGAWCWPPTPPPKCRGHERLVLYLHSPSGPSWPVIGRALPFFYPQKEGCIGPRAGLDGLQEKIFVPAGTQTMHLQLLSQ